MTATLAARTDTAPAVVPAGRIDPATWWRHTLVFARRNAAHVRQIPEKLFDVTIQPLMFVLLFAYVFGGAIDVGGPYREFLLAGIMVQSLTFGLVGPASAMATDLTEGVLDRFRSLPTARSSYLGGHVLAELGAMTLSLVLMVLAGLLVGWRTHTDLLHLGVAAALLLLFASSMIAVGTYLGLVVRTPDAVMGIAFPVAFPLTFISGAFVPLDSLPTVLEHVAAWNPITTMVAAVRELFGNPDVASSVSSWPLDRPVFAGFLWSGAILAVFVPLCLARFKVRTTG
jgi:ABC-2 type transport system permease protein